jgi:hypothetical protein
MQASGFAGCSVVAASIDQGRGTCVFSAQGKHEVVTGFARIVTELHLAEAVVGMDIGSVYPEDQVGLGSLESLC